MGFADYGLYAIDLDREVRCYMFFFYSFIQRLSLFCGKTYSGFLKTAEISVLRA